MLYELVVGFITLETAAEKAISVYRGVLQWWYGGGDWWGNPPPMPSVPMITNGGEMTPVGNMTIIDHRHDRQKHRLSLREWKTDGGGSLIVLSDNEEEESGGRKDTTNGSN